MKSIHLLTALFTILTITTSSNAQAETREQKVIYGEDGRNDLYDVQDPTLKDLALQSTASLFSVYNLNLNNSDAIKARGPTYQNAYALCEGTRFSGQPTGAYCSGVLIAPDLLLTAGHCATDSEDQCPLIRVVFDYAIKNEKDAPNPSPIAKEDIYSCTRIVAREQNATTFSGATRDWAIIQLDRPIDDERAVVSLRQETSALAQGTDLTMIGSPSGLPMKVENTGQVRNPRTTTTDYFVATTDSFGGNSGSPVFSSASHELIGILTAGATDYVQNDAGTCMLPNKCAEGECGGETVMYSFRAIRDLCDEISDPTLCGTSASCGDGYCSDGEDCDADCNATPVCGDLICYGATEWEACPGDCQPTVPQEWTCADGNYGTFNTGCQNNCGVPDPDCSIDSPSTANNPITGGCSSTTTQSAPITGFILFAGLFGCLWNRRRREV